MMAIWTSSRTLSAASHSLHWLVIFPQCILVPSPNKQRACTWPPTWCKRKCNSLNQNIFFHCFKVSSDACFPIVWGLLLPISHAPNVFSTRNYLIYHNLSHVVLSPTFASPMSGHYVLAWHIITLFIKKICTMHGVGLACMWLTILSLSPRCSPMFPLHPGLHTLAWRCWSSLAAHYFSSRHPVGCPHWHWWVMGAPPTPSCFKHCDWYMGMWSPGYVKK